MATRPPETVRESVARAVEGSPTSQVEHWQGIVRAYERKFKNWEARVERILKRYRDENRDKSKDGGSAKFNILWSNVQTLLPAVYSRMPKADVSRRFRDSDPVGRVAGLILERACQYEIEHYPYFRNSMKQAVLDRFLGGRGTAWARYEPHIRAKAQDLPTDGDQVTEDVDEPQEELDYECSPTDYVPWRDFGHNVCRTWEEVTCVWRKVYMTRQACVERFGEELGNRIPLDAVPEEIKKDKQSGGENANMSRALVYEIWDKETLKAYWMAPAMPELLDEKDDPLKLEGFFPCPKPLYATMTNESLEPIPDFSMYQDQAKELDTLSARIQGLINALKINGVYDASVPELKRIFTEGGNTDLIPVKNWMPFAEKGGLAGAIDIVELKPIYEALREAYNSVQQVLQQIYDLTGISDIIRGQSNANETATAQRIKGQYASLRLKSLQTEVAEFASALIQMQAQIICGQYQPETILKMAAVEEMLPEDQALIQPAIELLIGPERMSDPVSGEQGRNPMRSFRIEVNSDTMVQIDEDEEKTKRVEFLTSIGTFMEKAMPMAEASEEMRPLILQLMKFAVGAFKVGKTIEGAFDATIEKFEQQAKQPKPPKQDPEMMRVQADTQIQQARVQADQQTNQMKMQAAAQEAQAKMQAEAQAEQMRMQAESERHMRELQANAAESQRAAQIQQDTELKKTALQVAGQIEVARINADAKDKADARASELAGMQAEKEAQDDDSAAQAGADTQQIMQQLLETQSQLLQTIAAPKQVMRDEMGRVIGMQVVK